MLFYYVVIKCPKSEHNTPLGHLENFHSLVLGIHFAWDHSWIVVGKHLSIFFNAHTLAVSSCGNPFQKILSNFPKKGKKHERKKMRQNIA